MLKNLLAMQKTQVRSLGWEDPLEKEMATPPVYFPGGSDGKESACNAGDSDSTSESGGSPGEGNGNPL